MIDRDNIKAALQRMDTSNGIKIADLVIALGHRPNKETNRTVSKSLLTLYWSKGTTRYRAQNKSLYYLWFPPVITTTTIDTTELNQLKESNWAKDSKIQRLEQRIIELEQELSDYQTRKIVDIDAIREKVRLEEEKNDAPAHTEPAPMPQTVSPVPPATLTSPALSAISQSQLDKLMSQFKPRFREPLAYILQNWTQTQDKRGMKVKVDFRLVPNAPATSVINQTCSEMFGKGWLKADGSSWWIVSGDLLEVLEDIDTDDQTDTEDLEMMENMAG
jgi:hypothetical protein